MLFRMFYRALRHDGRLLGWQENALDDACSGECTCARSIWVQGGPRCACESRLWTLP